MFDALRDKVMRPRREDSLSDTTASLLEDDPALFLLAEELGELGGLELSAAPRERTLARVRGEVRTQQARGAFVREPRNIFSRVALGGAALLVAASIGLFALVGGPGQGGQDQVAGSSSTSDTLAGGTTTDTRSPDTTGTSAPVTSEGPVTTVPVTTQVTDPDDTPATDDHPDPTSPPSSTRPHTTTTVTPGTTSTTGDAVMTWEDREDSAKTVVMSVADKIGSGALQGVDTNVASSARSGLAQMIASLERPSRGRIILPVKDMAGGARVLLEMIDNVSDGQGGLMEVNRRFFFVVSVDESGALVTAIYAAQ